MDQTKQTNKQMKSLESVTRLSVPSPPSPKNRKPLNFIYISLLKHGLFWCYNRLVNAVKPGSIPEKKYANPPTMSFKQMELIGLAIDKMKTLGVPDHEMFQTVDLYEAQNLHQVVISLSAVARKVLILSSYCPHIRKFCKLAFCKFWKVSFCLRIWFNHSV